jgi:hypothetical protein
MMESVYCAVRTGSLNIAVCASSVKGYRAIADVRTQFIITRCYPPSKQADLLVLPFAQEVIYFTAVV